MINKYPYPKKAPKWLERAVFGTLMFWAVSAYTGMRLPYIYTEFAFQARAYFLFPLLLGGLAYLVFVYRRPSQPTGYMQTMNQLKTRKEKIQGTLWGLGGLVLLPSGFAWTSIAFPAWAAELTASEPYRHVYQVVKVKARSGAMWSALFDLTLESEKVGEPVVLRLNREMFDQHSWKRGEMICVIGRTSIFGIIIDTVSADLGNCD